jgi:broad specificity phosphatase PhoE
MEAFSGRVLAAMRSISGPAPLLVVAHSGVFRVLGRHAGLRIDSSTSISSGHLLLFEPSPDSARTWRISEVSG